ncbi:DNA alkylation repair protein [Pseudochryseolinea flava]|uniref:DNA alkylation repair protein n=1 Tax=Pseudochryseolinea flava TaxID=2059302 RepID=A0A364Y6S6_9BACT|nr:DNA alkylation repair protein [Pseudochryseolinea flava]RAW02107.1 DNA alkylation repair protein [Pseudochryseolinea flava]
MEPLKEMFGHSFYKKLAHAVASVHAPFQAARFIKEVTHNIEELSLNQRMRKTSVVLHQHLPANYTQALGILKDVVPQLNGGYTTLLFPDFVSQYGLPYFHESLDALKYFTSFGSSEFAIRVFLLQDFDRTMKKMVQWSTDENFHVRRLSSEGSRPRLPWSFKLDQVIQNPSITSPILENLKCDGELYVRKSVANHLNDISKDSPEHVLRLVNAWDKTQPHTAWIVKRGIRSLLKDGDKKSMSIFGLEKDVKISIKKFKMTNDVVRLNDVLEFQFDIVSAKSKRQKLMVDYRIHYYKKSGIQSGKVFKLKEVVLAPDEIVSIVKRQRFQDFTTRKLNSGQHLLEIIVNGEVVKKKVFEFSR